QPDLPVDHRRRSGLAKRLDQPGHPRMPGEQTLFQLDIDLKIQPLGHSLHPHRAGETYHHVRTKAESTTSVQNWTNPDCYSGIRASASEMVESLLAMWAAGGERAEDLDQFRQDQALALLLGHELPAA